MRLGSDTNSVSNWMMSGPGQPKPEVGMGATVLAWTDRYAGTITKVSPSGKTIEVTEDDTELIAGKMLSEHQEYRYTPNPNGRKRTFRLNKKGCWRETGRGAGLRLGTREAYRDPSF
jgi:hypothetical protein